MTGAPKKKYKILVVDDDQFLLNMYSVKFTSMGFDTKIANGPKQALSEMENGLEVDALIFDVVMPGMDGLEMLGEIKKKGYLKNAVYVALTNQGQSTDVERAKKLGVHGYIVKASSIPSEVVAEVSRILAENNK